VDAGCVGWMGWIEEYFTGIGNWELLFGVLWGLEGIVVRMK
jgi:hypothetical protein